jgi:hypothetical protein
VTSREEQIAAEIAAMPVISGARQIDVAAAVALVRIADALEEIARSLRTSNDMSVADAVARS